MEDQDIRQQIASQQEMLDKIYESVEKTRKYFLWTMILSIVFFVLPLIGVLILLPTFISQITAGAGGVLPSNF